MRSSLRGLVGSVLDVNQRVTTILVEFGRILRLVELCGLLRYRVDISRNF